MGKYFILYNNETNLDIDLLIRDRPSKPSPEMEYEEVKVPGGKTLYREKGYKDIDIPISFNFLSITISKLLYFLKFSVYFKS